MEHAQTENSVKITTRDKLLRSWLNSMETVRDYRNYAEEIKDDKALSELFKKYAEDIAFQASEFHKLLLEKQKNCSCKDLKN